MSTVIVETLTGRIAETDRPTGWSMGARRPEFQMRQICQRMNEDAERMGLKTRYEMGKACAYCDGTSKVRFPLRHEPAEECGFCENGVVR